MTMIASPNVRRRPDMKALFFEAAKASGLENEDLGQKLIETAARQGRSVIDDLIDSKQVNEEDFLRQVAATLGLPYENDVKPRHSRKLRIVCGAQLALRHRVLPLALGAMDLPADLVEDAENAAPSALPDVEAPPETENDEAGPPDRIILVTDGLQAGGMHYAAIAKPGAPAILVTGDTPLTQGFERIDATNDAMAWRSSALTPPRSLGSKSEA